MNQRGYSLLELAIVIGILGMSALMFVVLTTGGPSGGSGVQQRSAAPGSSDAASRLGVAEAQILGFIRTHNRLPCPDVNGDGLEQCADGVQVGSAPYRTMGLTQPLLNEHQVLIRYGVFRRPQTTANLDTDLAVLRDRYNPGLPAGETTGVENALDFCWSLRTASTLPALTQYLHVDTAQPINQAFVLVDPGSRDADGSGSVLDGANVTGPGFESPGRALTETYDDRVRSMGFNQLASRLGCPALLAEASGAARAAVAADDLSRLTDFFRDFRAYSHRVAEAELVLSQVGLAFTVTGNFKVTVDTAVAAVQLLTSGGTNAAITAVAAAGIAANTALLVVAYVDAIEALIEAEEWEEETKDLHEAAVADANAIRARAAAQLAAAKAVEREARLR